MEPKWEKEGERERGGGGGGGGGGGSRVKAKTVAKQWIQNKNTNINILNVRNLETCCLTFKEMPGYNCSYNSCSKINNYSVKEFREMEAKSVRWT